MLFGYHDGHIIMNDLDKNYNLMHFNFDTKKRIVHKKQKVKFLLKVPDSNNK